MFEAYKNHEGDSRIEAVAEDMAKELGDGNKKPEILHKLAQYELTLLDWIEGHKGSRKYVAIAGKCWPAFQTQFGFVPCYVNSRLTKMGIPVSCEVDIYGALSDLLGTVITQDAVTLLDINNTVPKDMYEAHIKNQFPYTHKDVFMGFHCGNTPSSKLSFCEMKYQMIMARSLPEEVTQGTLEGDIAPGEITFFQTPQYGRCASSGLLYRERCFRSRHSPLEVSVSLQFLKWDVFTVMCLLKSIIRITGLLPLAM